MRHPVRPNPVNLLPAMLPNYYHLLGLPPTAAPAAIAQAHRQQVARVQRRRPDATTPRRLEALQTAHDVLLHPGRRWAYDQLLAQEPRPPHPAAAYGRAARGLCAALLALALLLGLDWALPTRQYAYEPVQDRRVVVMSSSAADPQMGYDIFTPHGRFRLHTSLAHRVRAHDFVTLWCSPLLGVVRQVRAPFAPDGQVPFVPDSGTLYRLPFLGLLPLLAALAGLGLLPRRRPEWPLNMGIAALLVAVLVGVVGLVF